MLTLFTLLTLYTLLTLLTLLVPLKLSTLFINKGLWSKKAIGPTLLYGLLSKMLG